MDFVKVALVGAGGMGSVHSTVYSGISDVKVTAVADVCRDRAEKAAYAHGAAVYASIDELLEKERPDLVDLCTPTYLHSGMAVKALTGKAHVLCEKPMALNTEDGEKMLKAARENGRYLMVGQVIRFWPEYVYLKQIYDKGTYGKLNQILFSRIGQRPKWSWENWMMYMEKSGRAPLDLHIHDTDFILHMLGKPKAVYSSIAEKDNTISYILTQYVYDTIVAVAEGAWYDQAFPFSMTFRAAFDRAILEFRDNKLAVYPEEGEPRTVSANDIEKAAATGINISSVGAYENEIRYFIRCIRNGVPPETASPESTVECLNIALKEVESARTGKIVYI